MFDWTRTTKNPNDKETARKFIEFLMERREVITRRKGYHRHDILLGYARGKSVLDIGPGDHTVENIGKADFLHKKLYAVASYVLGIDINKELCTYLTEKGYNVKCADASSDTDLGMVFDVAILGDVIEHMGNLTGLLHFSKKHLKPGGKLLISTPNPLCDARVRMIRKSSALIANFEHTCWITPTNMNELARRTGLSFEKYYVEIPSPGFLGRLFPGFRRRRMSDFYSRKFLYVLSND